VGLISDSSLWEGKLRELPVKLEFSDMGDCSWMVAKV
jgi:hypothetical protein